MFRVEHKFVSRKRINKDGSITRNSSVNAAAYISASEIIENHVIEAAAYISGDELCDDSNNAVYDYTKKKGVECSFVMLPPNAPKEFSDPAKLWNSVEKNETSKDAVLYMEWICCFDKHLTSEQRLSVAQEFGQSLVAEGMAVHIALHSGKNGNNNEHMHVLAPTRGFDENGNWEQTKTKKRGYVLDHNGERIPVFDKNGVQKRDKQGRVIWKRTATEYLHGWNDKRLDNVSRWRRTFADIENKYLPEEFQVSPDSYQKQGIEKIPGVHLGKAAFNTQSRMLNQVEALSQDQKSAYLNLILNQVQSDYRRVYYDTTRNIAEEKKMRFKETDEHRELRNEVHKKLQSVQPVALKKNYVSKIVGRNQLVIEKALCDIAQFYSRCLNKDATENITDAYVELLNQFNTAADILISTFAYGGITKATEQFIFVSQYEIKKELLKTIGEEIKSLENEIKAIKEGGEVDTNEIERKLEGYRSQLKILGGDRADIRRTSVNDSDVDTRKQEHTNSTFDRAREITESVGELEKSRERLGILSRTVERATKGTRIEQCVPAEQGLREAKKKNKRMS